MNHQLIGAGAAFSPVGERLYSKTTSGYGQALCSCGWLSEAVEYGRERKRLHAEHAADIERWGTEAEDEAEAEAYSPEMSDLIGGGEPPADEPEESPWDAPVAAAVVDAPEIAASAPETPDVDEDPEPEQIVPETATEEAAEAILAEGETYDVEWPDSVARLFWSALAKDGLGYIAESHGMTRVSVESRGVLRLIGPGARAYGPAVAVIFRKANKALKAWRKTSEAYGQFRPLNTKERLRDAFNSEKAFLREFCRAWAGLEALGTNPDGYAAGRGFRGEDVL